MKNKKMFYNKTGRGLASLAVVVILLSAVLASSIFYQNNITANVVKETSINDNQISMQITAVNDIKELNQLNEGWYHIKNGYAYYLEHFDTYVPLYIKVKNQQQQNGLLLVEADGKISFDESFEGLTGEKAVEEKPVKNEETSQNQVTGKVIGMEKVSGDVVSSTPPLPPSQSSKSSSPPLPEQKYDSQKIPKKRGVYYGTDGETYGRSCDTCSLLKVSDGDWQIVQQTYYAKVRDSAGIIQEVRIEAPTEKDARKQFTDAKLNVISISTQPSAQPTLGYGFYVKEIGGVAYVTNDKASYLVPSEYVPDDYANYLNDKAKITQEYNAWLKEQKLTDTLDNRKRFQKYPPSDVNQDSILDALGLLTAQKEGTKQEKIPYDKIKLPDGNYLFIYNKIEYLSDSSGSIPTTLQSVLDFKKNHPTAVLQQGFKTTDNGDVYLEKGNYIDVTGGPVDTAVKKEKIGGTEYDVNYKFEKGKKFADEITIDEQKIKINDNVLNGLKSNIGKGDNFFAKDGLIYITKSSTSKEGKGGTDSYKETTTATSLAYNTKGLEYSEVSSEIRDKDGNLVSLVKTLQQYGYDKETDRDLPTYTTKTDYQKKEGEKSIDENSADYTKVRTNTLTGEPLELIIDEGGKNAAASYDPKTGIGVVSEGIGKLSEKAKAQLSTLRTQYSSQQFFANVESVLTEFQGLGYYSTLFFDEDSLLKWRDNVDRAFATLYLGTEYWSSAICSTYIDGENEGIAYAETPQGLAQVAAHIEATRTEPIQTDTGREFIYMITFNVRNGDFDKDLRAPEEMNVNVVLKGDRTVNVFRQAQKIKRGDTFGMSGRNAIVKSSSAFYNQVCITFDKTPLRWKISNKEICNTIQQSSGTPTPLGTPTATTQGTTGSGTGNINDF